MVEKHCGNIFNIDFKISWISCFSPKTHLAGFRESFQNFPFPSMNSVFLRRNHPGMSKQNDETRFPDLKPTFCHFLDRQDWLSLRVSAQAETERLGVGRAWWLQESFYQLFSIPILNISFSGHKRLILSSFMTFCGWNHFSWFCGFYGKTQNLRMDVKIFPRRFLPI
jgi:hypothetical protein